MTTLLSSSTIPINAIPPGIVLISRDSALQLTRQLILEREGYTTIALTSEAVEAFLATEPRPPIGLVLLCHSLPEISRIALCRSLKKRYPDIPIVLLFVGLGSTLADVDVISQQVHSPEELVSIVKRHAGGLECRKRPRAKASVCGTKQ